MHSDATGLPRTVAAEDLTAVRAAAVISATTFSAAPSETTTSTFIFGRKSTVYSEPR